MRFDRSKAQKTSLALHLKRQARIGDKPVDEPSAHGRARRPNAAGRVDRVAHETNRALGDHLGRGAVSRIPFSGLVERPRELVA